MLRDSVDNWPMITAGELRDARVRAGFTSQAALAEALNVSERTVTSWEAEGSHVSTRAEARVRALLWPAPGPLSAYSDYELLSEIGRRLESARRHAGEMGHKSVPNPGESSPAYDVDRTIPSTSVEGTAGPHSHPRSRS